MLKAKGIIDGRPTLVIGLSHLNLDRLRADGLSGCILIRADEYGISHDIQITAAETEAVLLEVFAPNVGPDTKVHISDKLKLKQ